MNKVLAIALNTFREAIRNKILYALLFFAVVMIFSSMVVGELSLGHTVKVTKDIGLTAISLFGILIAIFTGVNLVYKELDKRTIFTIVSKPIHRYQFILGKYFGMLMTVGVQMVLMGVVLSALLVHKEGFIDYTIYKAVYLFCLEVVVITSVALFFSSFTTPFFSGVFSLAVFVLGRLVPDVLKLLEKIENPVLQVMLKLASLLPDLQHFNVVDEVVHGTPISAARMLWCTVEGVGYSALFLVVAAALFSRRDFV